MKKSKIATLAVTAFITIALYIYSLYSAYWTFKRGNVGEIILYTALLALCNGAIMLLYTLTDKKRSHSTANKVIVPIAALLFKLTAAVCALSLICSGLTVTYRAIGDYSFLKPFYEISKASSDIGGIPTKDADIVFDFAYATEKDVRDTALGKDETIDIALAKNEWEGFRVVFATAAKDKKVNVSVTDFKNSNGDTLKTEVFKEHYLEVKGLGDVYNCEYPDALIPVTHTGDRGGAAELQKGLQQAFFIRTRAEKDSSAGEYTATVTAVNEKDEVILEKEIKATVWDFTLPDAPANESAFGNGGGTFYTLSGVRDGDDEAADPRVTSFVIPYPEDDDLLVEYYTKVTSNPDWAKKGYFYPIDEPGNAEAYAKYTEITDRLNRLCPGYNMVTPFNTDKVTIDGKEMSSVQLQAGKSSILCGLSKVVNRGTTLEEMMAQVKNGSRAWWYVCCAPGGDYCNFFEFLDGIKHRLLMWQQRSLDISGLLYWSTTYCEKANPWESTKTWDDYNSAGDGMLIYPGGYIGFDGPIASLRLMNIADGMEDYDYFALAEAKFGKEWVNEKIAKVVTSPTEYTSDHALFEQVRREIGVALAEA